MKKFLLRSLSILLAVVLFSGGMPVGLTGLAGISAKAVSKTWAVGDTGYMGMYPQTQVTDAALLSELNAQTLNWVSYGYYSGEGEDCADGMDGVGTMAPGDWMKYTDVDYGGNKYRAVTFSQYRPWETYLSTNIKNSINGLRSYTAGKIYWFRYRPIAWRVLDPTEGLVMSEKLLDSQAYSNVAYCPDWDNDYEHDGWGGHWYNDVGCTTSVNDYVTSSIRKWLTEDFYNTAFSYDEQADIKTTALDNSDFSTEFSQYDSKQTNDKIFLLSYAEAHNPAYGFDGGTDTSSTRYANGTDYADCQSLGYDDSDNCPDNCAWWLRSPGKVDAFGCVCAAEGSGELNEEFETFYTCIGVRPALKIDLQSAAFKSDASEVNSPAGAADAVTGTSAPAATTDLSTAEETTERQYSGLTEEASVQQTPVPASSSGSKTWIIVLAAVVVVVGAAVAVIIIAVKKKGSSGPGGPGNQNSGGRPGGSGPNVGGGGYGPSGNQGGFRPNGGGQSQGRPGNPSFPQGTGQRR